MLSRETLQHRNWISERWIDTEAGQNQDIKMLEYACGVGVISMVCIDMSMDDIRVSGLNTA